MADARPVQAPRGTTLTCKGWPQEAAMRMLMNNLDPEVAEHPDQLIVYGGSGRAARSWDAFDAIVASLRDLEGDETLLVQSGKPVGVLRTHEWAPRVLIANSNLVPAVGHLGGVPPPGGGRADHVRADDRRVLDLHRHPGHPAGHLRDVRRRRRQAVRRHAGRDHHADRRPRRHGRRPAARRHHERRRRARASTATRPGSARRIEHGYLDVARPTTSTTPCAGPPRPRRPGRAAVHRAARQRRRDRPAAAADGAPDRHRHRPDLGPRPADLPAAAASRSRTWPRCGPRTRPASPAAPGESMAEHVAAMVGFQDAGAEVFDYGNSIRGEAQLAGYERAFDFPGFVPAYIRPLFCEGTGPVPVGRAVRRPGRHRRHRRGHPRPVPRERGPGPVDPDGPGEGRTSRACPRGSAGSATASGDLAGQRFNELVASGDVSAPIVIGRDHLDCGSVASPYRETEAMADGSDAIADWPLLNALVNTSSGRLLGEHPPRRRRRHRPLHPRRPGLRGRRHRAGRPEAGAGADQRPRHGRDPARRRRLRPRRSEVAAERGVRVPMPMPSPPPDGRTPWSSPSCGSRCCRSARDAGTGGYRRLLLDPGRPGLPRAGSPRPRGARGLRSRPTATATCGPGGASARRPAPWRPAATWTPCPTAARSTARSASSRPSPRSTCCASAASRPPGRSRWRPSPRRRAPASAWPAWAAGC